MDSSHVLTAAHHAAEIPRTALVIDDNAAALLATSSLLAKLGFDVCEADGPQAALDAVERAAFDLVVSDINMPGDMDGVQLVQLLRQRNADLPIILMTGFAEKLKTSAGEFIVLAKPFGTSELRDALHTIAAI